MDIRELDNELEYYEQMLSICRYEKNKIEKKMKRINSYGMKNNMKVFLKNIVLKTILLTGAKKVLEETDLEQLAIELYNYQEKEKRYEAERKNTSKTISDHIAKQLVKYNKYDI